MKRRFDVTLLKFKVNVSSVIKHDLWNRIEHFVTTASSVFNMLALPPSFPLRGGEQRTPAQPKEAGADQRRSVWSSAGLAVRGCSDGCHGNVSENDAQTSPEKVFCRVPPTELLYIRLPLSYHLLRQMAVASENVLWTVPAVVLLYIWMLSKKV